MSIFEAILQGIIQGATEFLPISSSGHLALTQHIFGIELPSILFDIMLHLGTLIAVLFVYRKLIWRLLKEFVFMIRDIFKKQFKWSEMSRDRRLLMMLIIGLVPLFLLFLPIPGAGMKVKDLSEMLATSSSIIPVGLALLATSVLLFSAINLGNKILSEKKVTDKNGRVVSSKGRTKIHTIDALLMGLAQLFAAVFPGLSRSGSTLSVGMMRGINKQAALDYSFVLGIPAILAASVVSIKDIGTDGIEVGAAPLMAGIITAAVVGFIAIKVLKWIVTSDKLSIFAYYTLIVGGVATIIGIIEQIMGKNIFTGMPL